MPRLNITDDAVRRLPHSTTTVWYSDATMPAFQLAVGQTAKSYFVIGRVKGTKQLVRLKLGRFPLITATAAGRAAKAALDAMAEGRDPRVPAEPPPPSFPTLQAVLDDYIDYRNKRGRLSEVTAKQYRNVLRIHAADWLEREINTISKADVRRLHDGMADRPYMANQVLRVLRFLFRHAIERLDHEMVDPTRGTDLFPEHARQPIDDLAGWYQEVMAIENPVRRNYLLLACLTGVRRENLASLTWEQVDFRKRVLRLTKTKNRSTPTLPLSRASVRLLIELRRLGTARAEELEQPISQWVFPAFSRSGHIAEPKEASVRGNVHQLRHAFTSAGAACGTPHYVLKKLRGDITREDALDAYVHSIASHQAVNAIADHLMRRWGVKRAAAEQRMAA